MAASYMVDGFATIVTFGLNGSVRLEEKTVTPPGFDSGGPINVHTMNDSIYILQASKVLRELTEISITGTFLTGGMYQDLILMLGVNQLITVTFPDASAIVFWGYIDKAKPGVHEEGKQPTIDVVIVPTNTNSNQTESGPVFGNDS